MAGPTLSETCEELWVGLEHEFGIPELWPDTARGTENVLPETGYFSAISELSQKLDHLVYLNRIQELVTQDMNHISKTYSEVFDTPVFRNKSNFQIGQFLGQMADFKRHDLGLVLAAALPLLRSVFQENSALTNAELSVLNNIKKLGSAFNAHPANIHRLIPEYERSLAQLGSVAEKESEIQKLVHDQMKPHVTRLRSLAADLQALENTFQNQFGGDSDPKRSRTLLREHKKLEKKTRLLSILTDLIPQMILCLPTNWHEDERLHEIIVDCQDLSEKLGEIPRVSSMQDALSSEYQCDGL